MTRKLLKSRAAEADLVEIWVYSFKTWSEAQADRYLDSLEHGIKILAAEPTAGKERDALRKGYWSVNIGRHVVFYTFSDTEVYISRVLHETMDVERHL